MTDLYTMLDVARDATPAQIKAAYHGRAKTCHPDKGGSTEEFQALTKAYLVLSDPARRSKYDRTGQIDEKAVNNTLSQAVSAIIGVVMTAVEQHAAGGADPCSVDLVEVVRNMLKKQVAAYEDQKRKIEKVASTLEAIEKRWTVHPPKAVKKANAELLKAALAAQIRATDEPLRKTVEMVEINKLALELLANSTFDVLGEKVGERFTPLSGWKSMYECRGT